MVSCDSQAKSLGQEGGQNKVGQGAPQQCEEIRIPNKEKKMRAGEGTLALSPKSSTCPLPVKRVITVCGHRNEFFIQKGEESHYLWMKSLVFGNSDQHAFVPTFLSI